MATGRAIGCLICRQMQTVGRRGAQQPGAVVDAAVAWALGQGAAQPTLAAAQTLWRGSNVLGWHRSHSSQAGGDSSSSSQEAVVDRLDHVVDIMMKNPLTQQMLLSRLPKQMQKPEVLKAMMANPEVRQRIAAIAEQSGMAQMLSQLDPAQLQAQLSDSNQAGLDPAKIFARFQQSSTLGPRMNDPRVLAALMDMASNGAEALKKYEGDKDVIDAAMEAGDIIQQMQQEQNKSGGSAANSAAGFVPPSSSFAGIEAQLGVNPQEMMQRLMAKPDLLARVQDPKVQQALQDIAQSPWKIAKYLFDKDVMAAIKELKDVMKPQTGK